VNLGLGISGGIYRCDIVALINMTCGGLNSFKYLMVGFTEISPSRKAIGFLIIC
jgi:hypothetical protein